MINNSYKHYCSLYAGEYSTPSNKQTTGDEDGFSFHGSDVSPNMTIVPSWTNHCIDLNGILYSPVGYIDYKSPTANLRELSSLFAREASGTIDSPMNDIKNDDKSDKLCSDLDL